MAGPDPVRELIAALEELDTLWGVERAKRAKALKPLAREVLSGEEDRGIWQQTRPGNGTRKSVAQALGTTVLMVQKHASRHAGTRK